MRTVLCRRYRFCVPLLAFLFCALGVAAWARGSQPITQAALEKALGIGGLSTGEFVGIIQKRGVDFRLTPDIEASLRRLGAEPALIEAIRGNYRGQPAASGPLGKDEIVTLLQVGTSQDRVTALVRERGIAFRPTDAVMEELRAAGAGSALLAVIRPPAARPSNPPRAPARIPSLTEVRRLYVEKMPQDLDEYLRLEIGRQLAGQITVVLDRGQADAVLVGDAEHDEDGGVSNRLGLSDRNSAVVRMMDLSKRSIIWSAEAGDRSAFSAFRKGGQSKVAERLVKQLSKSLKESRR